MWPYDLVLVPEMQVKVIGLNFWGYFELRAFQEMCLGPISLLSLALCVLAHALEPLSS
jgi:hypothetical protein